MEPFFSFLPVPRWSACRGEIRKIIRWAGLLWATLAVLVAVRAQSNYATPYTFKSFAGVVGSPGALDATGRAARFNRPYDIAMDGAGNFYIADSGNNTIRKMTSTGVVTTVAGLAGVAGSADGPGSDARFNSPIGVAVDGAGNMYVADSYNYTIRKISPAGVVTTLAGSVGNPGSADGTGSAAQFYIPIGLAVDGAGNVYVADSGNDTIRMVTPAGVVTTVAGSAGYAAYVDGTGASARFSFPYGVALDGAGTLFVADTNNHTIRKITAGGVVTTFAGTGGFGSADGAGSAAQFTQPGGIALDAAGNVYVSDTGNGTVRLITPAGDVTTLAGTAENYGVRDGVGPAAEFYQAYGITADGSGNVFITDSGASTIRKVTSGGVVTTFAGAAPWGPIDGTGGEAAFNSPYNLAVDGTGNVYVADMGNSAIRKITPDGVVTTFAGRLGFPGSLDGTGTAARFSRPYGVATDSAGNVYVANSGGHTIRKITPAGVVTTLAGTAGASGYVDGTGTAARFSGPKSLTVDGTGNIYVVDGDNLIRKVTPAGVVTTLAGTYNVFGFADGTGTAAMFRSPFGVTTDAAGNVYVADTYNSAIRKITPAGVVTTFAGLGVVTGSADGVGAAARFVFPAAIAIDGAGNLYVTDTNTETIRKITPNRVVTTLAGGLGAAAEAEGTGSNARFDTPSGIAVDATGNLYVADTNNHGIRKGVPLVAGDFTHDLKPDILWQNTTSGKRIIWLMNGTGFVSSVNLGIVSTDWRISAAGDFNGDGKPDILWENTVTGDRGFWLMDGTTFSSWVGIGVVPAEWRIAAAGDFNGDAHPDILWENTVTGDRYFWMLNGTTVTSAVYFGNLATAWRIAAVGDFNGDGQPDILWQNTATGDRYCSLMNGTTPASWIYLGTITTDWRIAP